MTVLKRNLNVTEVSSEQNSGRPRYTTRLSMKIRQSTTFKIRGTIEKHKSKKDEFDKKQLDKKDKLLEAKTRKRDYFRWTEYNLLVQIIIQIFIIFIIYSMM